MALKYQRMPEYTADWTTRGGVASTDLMTRYIMQELKERNISLPLLLK